MTMHVVLGDGQVARRELTAALSDLWKADESTNQTFWFLLQGKSEPTETDIALVTWLTKNELYFEVVTDDPDSMNEAYAGAQEVHTATKIKEKVIALLQSKPEEDEPAELLALFSDVNDPTAAADKWLNSVLQGVYDSGFTCRALNDGLVEIDMSVEAEEAEAESVETPAPVKAVAKKAAPKLTVVEETPEAEVDTPVSAEDEAPTSGTPSRSELEDMDLNEVKTVAASLGINLPPRTRITTYISHILGEVEPEVTPAAEVEPETVDHFHEVNIMDTSLNGHIDADEIAVKVADILIGRLKSALFDA